MLMAGPTRMVRLVMGDGSSAETQQEHEDDQEPSAECHWLNPSQGVIETQKDPHPTEESTSPLNYQGIVRIKSQPLEASNIGSRVRTSYPVNPGNRGGNYWRSCALSEAVARGELRPLRDPDELDE